MIQINFFALFQTNVSARSVVTLAIVSRYVSSLLEKFGIQNITRTNTDDQNITGILDSYVKFREIVRNDVLKEKTKNLPILKACDDARNELLAFGVHVKVRIIYHNESLKFEKNVKLN